MVLYDVDLSRTTAGRFSTIIAVQTTLATLHPAYRLLSFNAAQLAPRNVPALAANVAHYPALCHALTETLQELFRAFIRPSCYFHQIFLLLTFVVFLQQMLFRQAIVSRAPPKCCLGLADDLAREPAMSHGPDQRVFDI